VQAEAGLGLGVIGDLRSLDRIDRRIGVARGDNLDAARGERRRTLIARVKLFSNWPFARRPPVSSPP
jgi:hypothetical protein